MSRALILMLPRYAAGAPSAIRSWWLVTADAVLDSGNDGGWPDLDGENGRIIALAPPEDAPVHYQFLPDLTPPQARAAALAQASDRLIGATSHSAVGWPTDDGVVATVSVTHAAMAQWRAVIDAAAIDVAAIVPVAWSPPVPAEGQALRVAIGEAILLRTHSLCAGTDPVVDPLRLDALTLVDLGCGDRMLTELARGIPLDLLSGPYARRDATVMSPVMRRWTVRLVAALVLATLAMPLAQAWQRSRTIGAADARAVAAAARVGVEGSDAAAVEAELDRRLAARGGGPLGLSAPLGGLYRSLQAQAPVAVRSLSHLANGTLSVTLASPRIEDVNAVLADLQARGFVVTGQPLSGADGMQMATVTVRAVP